MSFDWNHARAFLITAEEGSLSAAARALNTSQPTLSRQVSALEDELGVVLFERVGKGMMLTETGIQLLKQVRQMGEAANQFSLLANGQSQSLEGRVCISASEIDVLYRMPGVIKTVQQQEPGIHLDVLVTNESSDLKLREADIAIRSYRPTEGDLIAKKLLDENIWFWGHKAYLASLEACSQDEFFKQVKVIGFGDEQRLISMAHAVGWVIGEGNFSVSASSHAVHPKMVKDGLGIGLFPEYIGSCEPDFQIALPVLGPLVRLPLWLVSHRELRTNPRIRRVFDIISDCLGA